MAKSNNREEMLALKQSFLEKNSKCFSGNTKTLADYKETLEERIPTLSKYQFEAAIGLILGDASIRTNNSGTKTGLTIQQGTIHDEYMLHLIEVFEEFTSLTKLPKLLQNRNVREFDTFKVKHFNQVATVISGGLTVGFPSNKKLKRTITELLKPFITPVSIAYMFGSDGARVNGGARSNEAGDGKGIRLHFQSFSKSDNELLSTWINQNCGFHTEVKKDKEGKHVDRLFVIDFPGRDYARFLQIVGPYVHPSMHHRIPLPRVGKDIAGNQKDYDRYVGSYFKNVNNIHDY